MTGWPKRSLRIPEQVTRFSKERSTWDAYWMLSPFVNLASIIHAEQVKNLTYRVRAVGSGFCSGVISGPLSDDCQMQNLQTVQGAELSIPSRVPLSYSQPHSPPFVLLLDSQLLCSWLTMTQLPQDSGSCPYLNLLVPGSLSWGMGDVSLSCRGPRTLVSPFLGQLATLL